MTRNGSPPEGCHHDDEDRLAEIPAPAPHDTTDTIYRIAYPFDFSMASKARTFVFGTSEYQSLNETNFRNWFDVKALARSDSFQVITPSLWSRQGFLHLGLRDDQVRVVPHGVASNIFCPSASARKALREKMNLTGLRALTCCFELSHPSPRSTLTPACS